MIFFFTQSYLRKKNNKCKIEVTSGYEIKHYIVPAGRLACGSSLNALCATGRH